MIKKFINDCKKYRKYITYSTKSQLKAEVTGSYLSWLWLLIEPICFMLIYTFISVVVFHSKMEYFTIFVFIGLTIWNFFQKSLVGSIKLVPSNRDTVTKVYIPKFILLITKLSVNGIKFFISFSLVVICLFLYQVPISFNVLYFIPLCIVLYVFTFGLSSIFMHFGVFVQDLANVTNIVLRLVFYASGIFFSIQDRIDNPALSALLVKYNPIAAIMNQCRNILLYKTPLDLELMIIWLIIGLILCFIGVKTIYKYENTYVKVMK